MKEPKVATRNVKKKDNGGEDLELKRSLGDGLVVGGYRELLINRAAEGLDVRFEKKVRKIHEVANTKRTRGMCPPATVVSSLIPMRARRKRKKQKKKTWE